MGLLYVILFVLILTYAGAYAAVPAPDYHTASPNRMLRLDKDVEMEERIDPKNPIPSMENYARKVKDSVSQSWISSSLAKETNPMVVFNSLNLQKAGKHLDEVPMFYQWLEYVNLYRLQRRDESFGDPYMLHLFQKAMSDNDAVTLVHKIRQVPGMKDSADTMQYLLFLNSEATHKQMINTWLQSGLHPEEVFKILRLKTTPFEYTSLFIQWFTYTNKYRATLVDISDAHLLRFMEKQYLTMDIYEFTPLFQSMKDIPGLKTMAHNMQALIFKQLAKRKINPYSVAVAVAPNFTRLPREGPAYEAWEAYTLFYAKHNGEDMLAKVTKSFADGNPQGALEAVRLHAL
ncbi:Secreted RxLR effector peptide protein [Phytophthora palmivora]|uniref:Secreted RxLR effector peptide protein n=1 Tax=Phytophthora palmivora TaxID=4796 RepID=A0A2P4Y0F3_9STRA|nr:Secreted RxLR effector peptide protein [Phytophthora palmivora]